MIWSDTMTPTCSELTSTLCGAPSCESALVNAIWAARLTEVGALSAPGALAPMLSTLMMRPHLRCFICGSRMRQKRIWANSFRSRSACHCSSVSVSDGPRVDCPALLTKISTLPNSELTCLQAASIAAAFETSQLIAETLPFATFWISPLASASVAASRARIATSAPEAANSLAIASPRPLLPPVTIALLPCSRTSMIPFLPRIACPPDGRRQRGVAAVFAGQQPIGERRERDQPEPVRLDDRHQLIVEFTLQQIVALLARDIAFEAEMDRGPLRLDDLPGRQGRAADVAHLALPHEIVERAQGLLDRRLRIGDVLPVEVEIVGVEAFEAGLDRAHDVVPRGALQPARAVHRPGEFAGQHHLVAPAGEA